MTPELSFMSKVRVKAILERRYEHIPNSGNDKFWKSILCVPKQGWIIGIRTLSNGRCFFEPEEGWKYSSKEHFQAYLVVFNIREKPVLVRPEDLKS